MVNVYIVCTTKTNRWGKHPSRELWRADTIESCRDFIDAFESTHSYDYELSIFAQSGTQWLECVK